MDVSVASSRGEDDPEKQAVEQIKRDRYISGKDVNDLVTTKHHVLSLYGPRTPVAVSENVFSQGAKEGASVNASAESEYAWYVYQRKLLLWRFKPKAEEKNEACSIAIELLLPKSDLPHHAHLVSVFKSRGSSNASCIAVSPEGVVRFWDVLSPHTSWVEVNANLGGEEVCSVHHVPPHGCIAVTTSASLILIKPATLRHSPTVNVKHISGQQGWLSGISRRMNTIIFGNDSHNAESSENKVVKMVTVCGLRRGAVEWQVFLLVGMKLQLKMMEDEQPAALIYEIDLEDMIQKQFHNRAVCNSETEFIVLDVRMSEGGLAILVASSEPRRYLLLELPCRDDNPPTSVFVLCDLCKRDIDILERNSGKIPYLQFLLLPTTALIFNRRTIIGVPLDGGSQSRGDVLSVPGEGIIVGGVNHKGSPAFFSPTYGFVIVQPVEGACYDILKSASRRTGRPEREPRLLPEQKHMTSIKTAFLMYIRQNMNQCHYVIDKEFPSLSSDVVDSPLSLTLLRFSLDIVHNAPTKDPRWEHFNAGPKLSGVVSLHVETQLQEKLKAHDMFLDFVYDSLASRIGKVTKNDKKVNVLSLIAEHNEKLMAAWKLCKLQESHGIWIDNAIYKAVDALGLATSHQSLTHKDIFYRYVSIVDIGIKCLIEECADLCKGENTLAKKKQCLLNTLTIVWEVAVSVLNKQRARNFELPQPQSNWLNRYTGDKAPYEYFKLLFEMIATLIEKTSGEEDEEFQTKLVAMTRDLVDVILHLQSTTHPPERYFALRSWYIQYFIDNGHYLYAKQLAVKFLDMKALVELTYILKETENLPKYIEAYGDIGICEEIFGYLLKKGLKADLLSLNLPSEHKHKLEKSLESHRDIYWLNKLEEGESLQAVQALVSYATTYNKDVDKCERMWSFAKLICKSEGISKFDAQINRHLECISAQRYLTDYLQNLGSSKSVKAYNEVQIIQMLVSPQNTEVSEYHFKKALDLLRFVEDEVTKEKLKSDIWSKAVQVEKDEFAALKVDSPVEEFADLLVFRLLSLIVGVEDDPDVFVPPFENLNVSDDVDTSKRFIYFLRLGHEHIIRTFHSGMDTRE
uniref:Nuclear pore complex protein Nup133 n=4 Tax=Lygus hesperus TaxID=30085 RepID=A0A146LS84_LYGHE